MNHSSASRSALYVLVVICFQLLSLWWITASKNNERLTDELWFAFSYYLCDESQLNRLHSGEVKSCDLLSVIIFVMNHSNEFVEEGDRIVVICFQLLSLWWITALLHKTSKGMRLWFAFSYYLCDESQLGNKINLLEWSCDLLSVIIFVMNHSPSPHCGLRPSVVICFQLLSLWWITAFHTFTKSFHWLWFAFSYYLCDESQPGGGNITIDGGCDLLSVIIFVMNHSVNGYCKNSSAVVICFQLLSLWWITAPR